MSPAPQVPKCSFCGKPITSLTEDYRKVSGWARKTDGAGVLRLREVSREWACRFCIAKERRGVNSAQGSLL